MAVDEVRERLRQQLEETYGMEGAAYLVDRPPGGWSDLVTKEYLDLRLEALEGRFYQLEGRFHREITRLIMWLVPAVFGGMAAAGGIVAAAA